MLKTLGYRVLSFLRTNYLLQLVNVAQVVLKKSWDNTKLSSNLDYIFAHVFHNLLLISLRFITIFELVIQVILRIKQIKLQNAAIQQLCQRPFFFYMDVIDIGMWLRKKTLLIWRKVTTFELCCLALEVIPWVRSALHILISIYRFSLHILASLIILLNAEEGKIKTYY